MSVQSVSDEEFATAVAQKGSSRGAGGFGSTTTKEFLSKDQLEVAKRVASPYSDMRKDLTQAWNVEKSK
jgi:hypothetical protein